jgi:2-dehydropantoate 2-reductase
MSLSGASRPRIAIVGSGAIGCYFGGCIAEAGYDVHFLMRRDYLAVREHGMTVMRMHAPSFVLKNVACYDSTSDIGPCDLVIVAVKSTSNTELAMLLPPLIRENTTVLTLQNGLGNLEYLMHLCGPEKVIGGIVFMGINRTGPGMVENYNPNGGNAIIGEPSGPATDRVREVCVILHDAKILEKASDDFPQALWRKLFWNIPFNGLTIAAGCVTCDVILDNSEMSALARGLMREVQAGAAALGIRIEDEFIDRQMKYTRSLGAYKPSSMLDFLAGRPLEIEAIWGEALRRGTAAGAAMPCTAMLYALLKTMSGARKGAGK